MEVITGKGYMGMEAITIQLTAEESLNFQDIEPELKERIEGLMAEYRVQVGQVLFASGHMAYRKTKFKEP